MEMAGCLSLVRPTWAPHLREPAVARSIRLVSRVCSTYGDAFANEHGGIVSGSPS